jgi:hypothetical protein
VAERHTIVVRVNDGKVSEVVFCDCCPGVTVEVRAYLDLTQVGAQISPMFLKDEAGKQESKFQSDEFGLYEAYCYEPDAEG